MTVELYFNQEFLGDVADTDDTVLLSCDGTGNMDDTDEIDLEEDDEEDEEDFDDDDLDIDEDDDEFEDDEEG